MKEGMISRIAIICCFIIAFGCSIAVVINDVRNVGNEKEKPICTVTKENAINVLWEVQRTFEEIDPQSAFILINFKEKYITVANKERIPTDTFYAPIPFEEFDKMMGKGENNADTD